MAKFRVVLREAEFHDYTWEVVADNEEEAETLALIGAGHCTGRKFVKGCDFVDNRRDGVQSVEELEEE